jgi:glycerophosphoryl diester phosphodiesterase
VDYTIELKCSPEEEHVFHPKVSKFVRRVVKTIKKYGLEERTLLQAFDQRVLKRLNERHPAVHCSYLKDETPDLEKELKELGFIPSVLGLRYDLVTKEIVQECEQRGMKVIPWTVNEVSDMKTVLEKGVHGIITDFPDRLPTLLEDMKKTDAVV